MTTSRNFTPTEWQARRAVAAQKNEMIKQLASHWSAPLTREQIVVKLEQMLFGLAQKITELGVAHNQVATKQIVSMQYMMDKFGFTEADVEEFRKQKRNKMRADLLAKPYPEYLCQHNHVTKLEGETFGSMIGKQLKCGTEGCEDMVDCLPRQLIYPEEAGSIATPPAVPGNGAVSTPVEFPAEEPSSIVLTD